MFVAGTKYEALTTRFFRVLDILRMFHNVHRVGDSLRQCKEESGTRGMLYQQTNSLEATGVSHVLAVYNRSCP